MNEEEILAEAIKRYPIGTRFRNYNKNGVYTITGEFKWGNNNNIQASIEELNDDKEYFGCVYIKGKWSEIIEYPENYKPSSLIESIIL